MNFLSTGYEPLDRMLRGGMQRGEITLIYGEPGTGTTSLAMQCSVLCARYGLKVLFIDSEKSFSLNRLLQIAGNTLGEVSPLIFVFKPENFEEQSILMENLENYLPSIALIVVDTITTLYRNELGSKEKVFTLNMKLNRQLAYLNEVARSHNTAVLLTSQVHSVFQDNASEKKIQPVANRLLKYWSQKIISLEVTTNSTIKKAVLEKGLGDVKRGVICFYLLSDDGIVKVC